MGEGSNYFRDRLTGVAAAATSEITFRAKEPKIRYRIENLSCKDETSNITGVEVLIRGHGYDHLIAEQKSPVADNLYWVEDDFWLHYEETLVIKFSGCTISDVLSAFISGYLEYQE